MSSFLDELASSAATPGGGAAAGVAGAMGAALMAMVARLSTGKDRYAAVEEEMNGLAATADALRLRFSELAIEDAKVYGGVRAAYRLPKDEPTRSDAIAAALVAATAVPMAMLETAVDVLALAPALAERGNLNVVSDVGAGAAMVRAAAESAALNVDINLATRQDEAVGAERERANMLLRRIVHDSEETILLVGEKIW